VPESDVVAASAQRAVADAKAASEESTRPVAGRRKGPPRARKRGGGTRTALRESGRPGARASQVIELVGEQPGITIRDLASAMNIAPNYLYRLLPRLEREGKVGRVGDGWVRRKIERYQM
jgi:predicted Rossmann fold nucleotide-binding protein DprA/Smf involved in DNA uptake